MSETLRMGYWLKFSLGKWGAHTERFEDGSRVVVWGYESQEEADARLRAFLADEVARMGWAQREPVFRGWSRDGE